MTHRAQFLGNIVYTATMSVKMGRQEIVDIVNRITAMRELFKLAAAVGLKGSRTVFKDLGIAAVKNRISTFISDKGLNVPEDFIHEAKLVEVKGKRQEARNLASEHNVDVSRDMNATDIKVMVRRKLNERESDINKFIVDEINNPGWVIKYDRMVLKLITSIFHISPKLVVDNKINPQKEEFDSGRFYLYDFRRWVHEKFVNTMYEELANILNKMLIIYKSRSDSVFKFKSWQDVLVRGRDNKYSILTLNIQDKTSHSQINNFDQDTIKEQVYKQMKDLLSFESEKLEVQISGSNFHVLLYSPLKLDIVLVTRLI